MAVATSDFPATGQPISNATIDPFPDCKGINPSIRVLWGRSVSDPGWGEDAFGHMEFDDENNHSVVTRIDFGESSLLITGDLEKPAITSLLSARAPEVLDIDIYQVGHHGSHNGTTPELLSALSPAWAVMQMGPPDRRASWSAYQYGHPREGTIALLQEAVSEPAPLREVQVGTAQRRFRPESLEKAILGTGWDGTIVLEAFADGTIARGTPLLP
jgi:competence protein ComEC